MTDPFRHHPGLRSKIMPAEESFFRDMDLIQIDAQVVAAGGEPDWRYPDDVREAKRREVLEGHWDDDIWVFAYGSLMWDPGMIFDEVRRAHAPEFSRTFAMWDEDARGSRAQPGLMLCIDQGTGCEGLVFRIARERIDHETFVLFRRELIAPGYVPTWSTMTTDLGPVRALAFVMDHDADNIHSGIPRADQARMIAVAQGMLGTNFEYLDNMHAQLGALNVSDPYVDDLYARVTALRESG